MSKKRILRNLNIGKPVNEFTPVSLAVNTSLSDAQCWNGLIIVTADAKAMTLPAASAALNGCHLVIQGYTATTVVVSAGFGGAGASFDTQTIASHTAGYYYCDGTNWYAIGQGTLS